MDAKYLERVVRDAFVSEERTGSFRILLRGERKYVIDISPYLNRVARRIHYRLRNSGSTFSVGHAVGPGGEVVAEGRVEKTWLTTTERLAAQPKAPQRVEFTVSNARGTVKTMALTEAEAIDNAAIAIGREGVVVIRLAQ